MTGKHRGVWWSFVACTCAMAVLQLDGTMVTAAVPALSRELAVDTAAASWMLIAYLAPFALLLLPGGRLTDQVGWHCAACSCSRPEPRWERSPPTSPC